MIIEIGPLIDFFDDPAHNGNLHASAVKAVIGEDLAFAVLKRYFASKGAHAELLTSKCKSRGTTGPRLDGWLLVSRRGSRILYQVEVKMWSATSLGGERLPIDSSGSDLRTFRKGEWESYWTGRRFAPRHLNKLLRPMPRPDAFGSVQTRPLACLWSPMHPVGGRSAFFRIRLRGGAFPSLAVFSISNYLRSLRATQLQLHLPNAEARLRSLARMFPAFTCGGEA